jgi:hypothetical protein
MTERSSPVSATSPIGQADVEMLIHLADSMGFGRTHDMLRRVIAACPYLTSGHAQTPARATPEMVAAAYAAYGDDDILQRSRDWLEAVINAALSVSSTDREPVQDTWLVGGPDLKAMSGSVESDCVIQLHFTRPVTDKDRQWLLEAINEKIADTSDTSPQREPDSPVGWGGHLPGKIEP